MLQPPKPNRRPKSNRLRLPNRPRLPSRNPRPKRLSLPTLPGKLTTIHGQDSWRLRGDKVDLYITRQGGNLAPATFKLGGGKPVQPFRIAPWAEEKVPASAPPGLKVLRGDFFCMPFGSGTVPFHGAKVPHHGEPANGRWRLVDQSRFGQVESLLLSLDTKALPGCRVDKLVSVRNGDPAIYCRHVVFGLDGPITCGHHPTLALPEGEGTALISTSGASFGQVIPEPFEDAAKGGYSSLKAGAMFRSLDRVPRAAGGFVDVSRQPCEPGYENIVLLGTSRKTKLAWTAAVVPSQKYVFLTIKDPKKLTGTMLWMDNGGRHYAPWNGRSRHTLGMEELTSYFGAGVEASVAENPVNSRGVPTHQDLEPNKPFAVNFIMAVGRVPDGFDHVATVDFEPDQAVLTSRSGKKATIPVRASFALGGGL